MRRLVRKILRAGHESDAWPVVILLVAVLAPAVCLVWLMSEAMRNERLATRAKLAEVYRTQLFAWRDRLEKYWEEKEVELERIVATVPAPAAFAEIIRVTGIDSVVIFDADGKIAYPNIPVQFDSNFGEAAQAWAEANQFEFLRKDLAAAAGRYHSIALGATHINLAARALQAEARCLVQAGQREAAIAVINGTLSEERFRSAADPQGRLIAANAELMALEFMDRRSEAFRVTAERLRRRLTDYENARLAAPQRRFLMKELRALAPGIRFPTLPAEELAARFCERRFIEGAAPADTWAVPTHNNRAVALVRSATLTASLRAITAQDLPAGAEVGLLAPGIDDESAVVTVPMARRFPGWRLGLSLKDRIFLDGAVERREMFYLSTGALVLAAMGVLVLLAVRVLRRRLALARLKNDLVATVSHELKTPLSSMRVLVDTLLDSPTLGEQTTREYLGLIAAENERLAGVIRNFLAFSRMERNKHAFEFAPVPVREIIETVVKDSSQRFAVPGCRFEVQVQPDLPDVMADPDALTAALLNLVDNAWKYSEDIKHVVLRACAENGHVVFSVQDNGIGIAARARRRIFEPFYQADQRLSRKCGGCGLGLSIVQFIATAHRGSVSVTSQPGCGI